MSCNWTHLFLFSILVFVTIWRLVVDTRKIKTVRIIERVKQPTGRTYYCNQNRNNCKFNYLSYKRLVPDEIFFAVLSEANDPNLCRMNNYCLEGSFT